ncbi:arginine repressor [Moritella sp. 24]|uniref:ArgR family transcriptional regulator n=1 Tax=Moritella sp. 24 TaxID=2746230 RepID=UPI001BA9C494|nr:ArgR family transcriptional regulator [Moritella sp. 24]QUM75015.1 arginine repressor [Moritella sp. 24]
MNNLTHDSSCEDMVAECKRLLRIERLSTQSEIRNKLIERGYNNINQSTISRMLTRLDIVKVTDAYGKKIYQLPIQDQNSYTDTSTKIIFITHNTDVVVIKTQPGCAQLIARLLDLDLNPNPEVLGIIAGNDMVLVAPKSIHNIEECECIIKHSLNYIVN